MRISQKHKPLAVPFDSWTFLEGKMKYLKNCLFWLNEYNQGRESKEELAHTISWIEKHCAEIRNEILNQTEMQQREVRKDRIIK